MYVFCPAWSIVPPGAMSLAVCWIVSFTVEKDFVGMSFVVWSTERRLVHCTCLLYKIYHIVNHSINKYLNFFVAARYTRASAAWLWDRTLQNVSIQSVHSACCWLSVELAAVGLVWWWLFELF